MEETEAAAAAAEEESPAVKHARAWAIAQERVRQCREKVRYHFDARERADRELRRALEAEEQAWKALAEGREKDGR